MEIQTKLHEFALTVPEEQPKFKYKILSHKEFSNLEDEVNQYIQKGWEPLGGVADTVGSWISQAMIKHLV